MAPASVWAAVCFGHAASLDLGAKGDRGVFKG